ncbi:MAG: Rossmann-like and DUF2520 domain-containing protein [Mangrovibacterium sp.]
MDDVIKKVSMIGAGNLATQLSKGFQRHGIEVVQVYSRTMESASCLAALLGAEATDCVGHMRSDSDLYVFSVKDDALEDVLRGFPFRDKRIVHTAGSLPMSLLKNYSPDYGVFYPLQTFSKQREVDFHDVPICIESSSALFTQQLKELAGSLSVDVRDVNSEQRKQVHLAAVFVCNFVNYLYGVGHALMEESQLDFDILKPLIRETSAKVMDANPHDVQTGPAVRFDEKVINKHLELLENSVELQELYSFVSKQIFQAHKKEKI